MSEWARKTRLAVSALASGLIFNAVAHAEGDAARNEAHFKECAACHKLAAGANEVGPSLHGLSSRKAA